MMTKPSFLFRFLLSLLAASALLVACGRSDLPQYEGTTLSTKTAPHCATQADCAATPATPLCDQGQCVACTTSSCPAGAKCDPASHTCVSSGCASDTDCSGATPHCRTDVHVCVECTATSQCPSADVCDNFKCVGFCGTGGTCPSGQSCCGPLCIDEKTDPANCGACGKTCGPYPHASAACTGSACAIGQCDPGFANCDQTLANGCEVDTGHDAANCGGCGKACPSGQACSGGVCVGVCGAGGMCPAGEACCGAMCASTSSDPKHCGSCATVCAPAAQASVTCIAGACAIGACASGFADCNKIEADGCEKNLGTDNANCGGCGNACAAGQTCSGGVCFGGCGAMGSCMAGLSCCGAACENLTTDAKNCGGCGAVCPPIANGTPSCSASACHVGSCTAGFADCDGLVPDGCEVDTLSDPANCGACGKKCVAGSTCSAGTCIVGTGCNGGPKCAAGQACCATGCVDTSSDPKNCSACGAVCPSGDACVASVCKPPMMGCNGGPACSGAQACCGTGCKDTTSDPLNCGGCGAPCPVGDTCVASVCKTAMTCNGGPVCTGAKSCCVNGCKDTSTDPQNCGGCGAPCPFGATCVAGACKAMMGCMGGPPCTGGESCCPAGCVDEKTDTENCGGCGITCKPGSACVGGSCQPAGCNNGPPCVGGKVCCATGCVDTTSNPNDCGGCGLLCPAGDTCVASMCQPPAGCNGGPACAGADKCCATGCADTTSDPKNCGACGAPCNPTDTCVAGMCQPMPTCNGGPGCGAGQSCCPSGCATTDTDPANCGKCGNACAATAACVGGTCAADEGAFNPTVNPTFLSPGVHNFTSINIPAGVTVYVAGPGPESGTLDLHASGAIVIDGVIDLSGGPGTQNTITSKSTNQGRAGSGGFVGEPYQSAVASAACEFIAGNPGSLGFGTKGTAGSCSVLSTTTCVSMMDPAALLFTAPVASFGGGAGVFTGYRAYGSGGGGIAGGAPGALGAAYPGEQDCSGVSGGGGATKGKGGLGGGAPYDGQPGKSGETQCPGSMPGVPPAYVGGGGGGSIGTIAASDLGVFMTFRTGSSGGGGSADYLNRPVFGGTSGGGGGGALRLSSPISIVINGKLLAEGGPGGDAFIGNGANAMCDPQPGAAGGGGSGGLIYLAAPKLTVAPGATVSAAPGPGGAQSEFATGGGGGDGGLGRVRISADPAACMLAGVFTPSLAAGCSPMGSKPGFAYVGMYPN